MSLYVRIENGEVKDCWDTPPDGRAGWKDAIEVKPAIENEGKNMIDLLISENKDFKNIILNYQ